MACMQSFLSVIKDTHSINANSSHCSPQTFASLCIDGDTENKENMERTVHDFIFAELKLDDSIKKKLTNRACKCMKIKHLIESTKEIHSVSDSQNCSQLLKQQTCTDDETLIQIMQAITNIFKENLITNKRMTIHCVKNRNEDQIE